MSAASVDAHILPRLKEKPFKVTTTVQFVNYFDNARVVPDLFCNKFETLGMTAMW